MRFAPITDYIVDVTTAGKAELMSALADVSGVVSVQDGGVPQVPKHGCDGHDHWLNTVGWNKALVINGFDKRAI